MGSSFIKLKGKQIDQQKIQPKIEEEIIPQFKTKQRPKRPIQKQVKDIAPVIKPISQNKLKAIQQSPKIYQLLQNQNWIVCPQIMKHLRILNAFQYVEISKARVLVVNIYNSMMMLANNGSKIAEIKNSWLSGKEEKHLVNELPVLKNEVQEYRQEYSVIYSDLFSIQFIHLKKLKIIGMKRDHPQSLVSLQILPRIFMPCLQQLSADNHNLTSFNFLKKCYWKNLSYLSLRGSLVYDSHKLAQVLPYVCGSQHLQILNISSAGVSQNWTEVSWLLKMGYKSGQDEYNRLQNDDEYYYKYEGKVFRRAEISNTAIKFRQKHVRMILDKFNHPYFDNPMSLWI